MKRNILAFFLFPILILLPLLAQSFATSIDNVSVFTDNRSQDDILGQPGFRFHIEAIISDPLGVPSNITSVTGVGLNQNDTYNLNYNPELTTNYYSRGPLYNGQLGIYKITVNNRLGETIERLSHDLTNSQPLPLPTNLRVSSYSTTTPVLSFDPIPGANYYDLKIFNSNAKVIYAGPTLTTPNIVVPPGLIQPGEYYFLSGRGLDFNLSQPNTGVNRLERRSVGFLRFQIGMQEILASRLGPAGANNPSGFSIEPINTATGNYLFSRVDLAIPGRGIPLLFQRNYNSQDPYSGPLGKGWTHSYNIILKESPDRSVSIKWGDGHSDFFDLLPTGTYSPRFGWGFDSLSKDSSGVFRLTKKNQTIYVFNSTGQPLTITERNGNSIKLYYDATGNLTSIMDTVGRTVILTYNVANQITQITDPIGRTVRYSYNSDAMLSSVTNPVGDIMTFTYDDKQRLSEIRDERGIKVVSNSYDGQDRVISQTNSRGFTTTLGYGTPQSDGIADTTITDPKGNVTVHTHDPQLRLIRVTDASGNMVNYTYDTQNNRTSITNQNNNVSIFTYDNVGNVLSITDPLSNVVSFTYDLKNNLTSTTNARIFTTKFEYDSLGNLTGILDALNNRTAFAYDSFGQLIQKIDTRGNSTQYVFDAQGNLTQVTDPLGGKTILSYDGIGKLISLTNPNGSKVKSSYDSLGRLRVHA